MRTLLAILLSVSISTSALASEELDAVRAMVAAQVRLLDQLRDVADAAAMTGSGQLFEACASGLKKDIADVRKDRAEQRDELAKIADLPDPNMADRMAKMNVLMSSSSVSYLEQMADIAIRRAAACNSKQLDQTAALAATTYKKFIRELGDMKALFP